MSWIVASLLNNKEHIKERADIESDEYNDLILIESAIKHLREHALLTEEDMQLLESFSGYGYDKESKLTRLERHTIAKKKAQICNRIAYYLGGYFTDDGYLSYVQKKYKLSQEQVSILENYIKSKKKHQIIRKPLNVK